METCEHTTELLWDHLYGLLEPAQDQALREHLAGCPACQAALTRVQAGQSLLARAARMYDSPTPLIPPAEETPDKAPGAAAEPAAQLTTLQIPVKPPRARRRWSWTGLAASLLAAVGVYLWYQAGLTQHQNDRNQALLRVQQIRQERPNARKEKAEQEAIQSQLVRLQLLGPASYQPGAPNQYRLQVRDLKGEPVHARVTVQVVAVAPDRRAQVLDEPWLKQAGGDVTFSLKPNLEAPARAIVQLQIQTAARRGREELVHPLTLADPGLITHLAIDRAAYQRGEVLFFRALTLERFSNRAPAQKLMVKATLVDAQGKRHLLHEGLTGPDGSLAGQIALTDDLCEGSYRLEVADRLGRFPPVQRPFVLRGSQAPLLVKDLQFDKATYAAGDKVNARLRVHNAANGLPAANRQVEVNVKVGGKRVPAQAPATNARGEANFQFMLPKAAAAPASVEVQLKENGTCERIVREIPVGGGGGARTAVKAPAVKGAQAPASPVQVEFYPEGGQLVAGLFSRVYFRARDGRGTPVPLQAALMDGAEQPALDEQGQPVVVKATRDGLGLFRFKPAKGHTYTLRIIAPQGVKEQPRLPAIQEEGVVLAVPLGVSQEGEPIRVHLRQTGAAGDFLVAVSCLGRLVDQKAVRAISQDTAVELDPPVGAHGVLRVTVYQARQGILVPRAERLVFRRPARRLQVAVQPDKPSYQPGQRVRLGIEARTEAAKPASAVMLAAVVDRSALERDGVKAEPNLPAPFYLTTALQKSEDLEQADVLVEDSPAARAALDRYLGTQGWRRFSPPPAPAPVLAMKMDDVTRLAAGQRGLAILSLNNEAHVQEEYQQEIQGWKEQQRVERKRRLRVAAGQAQLAETALSDFEQLPQSWLYWAGVDLVALLFAAGGVALVLGFIRLARGAAATPYFGFAFGGLLVCLIIVFLARPGERPAEHKGPATNQDLVRGPLSDRDLKEEEKTKAALPEGAARILVPLEGQLAQNKGPLRAGPTRVQFARKAAVTGAPAKQDRDKDGAARAHEEAKAEQAKDAAPEMRRRYSLLKHKQEKAADIGRAKKMEAAKKRGEGNQGAAPAPASAGALAKGSARGGEKGGKGLGFGFGGQVPVEYAHLRPRLNPTGDGQETVLWYPLLQTSDGKAEATFDLSGKATTFQILVVGHGADGRLGIAHGTLVSRPAPVPAKGK